MLTIAYVNFWRQSTKDCWFTKYFQLNFDKDTRVVPPTEHPDILLCSCMGPIQLAHMLKAKIKIFFYGENLNKYPPYNNDYLIQQVFDLVVGFKYTDLTKKQIRFPLWMIYYPYYSYDEYDNILNHIEKRRKECLDTVTKKDTSLVARHDSGGQRTILYNELSKYTTVYCPSSFRNNMKPIPPDNNSKYLFIRNTLYNICPENSAYEGYYTEKIFQALEAGCIPIYWAISKPEQDIINDDCYCFIDVSNKEDVETKIKDVVENNVVYQTSPLYKDTAHEAIKTMYNDLKSSILSLLDKSFVEE